jgi:hypothetical protein
MPTRRSFELLWWIIFVTTLLVWDLVGSESRYGIVFVLVLLWLFLWLLWDLTIGFRNR